MSHLMRPLGSADLKPRGYQQAAAAPVIPQRPIEEAVPEVTREEMPSFEPCVQPEEERAACAPPADETPDVQQEQPFDFSAFEDFSQDAQEDDEDADVPDAIPSEHMPEPVCVELFSFEEQPAKKKKNLLWIVIILLAAALAAAAWYSGLVSKLYAFVIDKTASMRYNLGTITFSFKPNK